MSVHPLADVLSITTGRLLSHQRMGGIYTILNAMTGADLFTHQLPRAADACAPVLLAQHPFLADVHPPAEGCSEAELMGWLWALEQQHGTELMVVPLTDWEHQNPVEELCDMVGAENVYVAAVPDA